MDLSLIASALVPTALLIGLGALLRRRTPLGEAFWSGIESLTYTLLLPALFLRTLATADVGAAQVEAMSLVTVTATLTVAALVWLIRPLLTRDGAAFTSVFQGCIRFNNYVGLVVAQTLFGPLGVALAALANAVLVPLVNVLATLALARHGHARLEGWGVLRAILTNPLVLACVLGALANLVGHALGDVLAAPAPATVLGVVSATLGILGQAALPLGLLCVGSGLRRPEAGGQLRPLVAASVVKLGLLPTLGFGLASVIGLTGPSATVSITYLALPVASSAYVLARRLGGDATLMASITAVQTLVALVTLPAWLMAAAAL